MTDKTADNKKVNWLTSIRFKFWLVADTPNVHIKKEDLEEREACISLWRGTYYDASAKASELIRQLALAGLGTIWIFRESNGKLPTDLREPAGLILLSLFLDLLQYVYTTIAWFAFSRHKELSRYKATFPMSAPPRINYPSWILFTLKIVVAFWAYADILLFISKKVF